MRAEIITVGTELMIGQTLDTHSRFLSQECVSFGIDVCYHTSVGDCTEQLQEVIQSAHSRSDLIFVCGGLGPTPDDVTKEIVSKSLGIPLVGNQSLLSDLHEYFAGSGRAMPKGNEKQALVFGGGIVFPNQYGTAPGLAVTQDGSTYILLPGPPSELQALFYDQVRPYLSEWARGDQCLISKAFSFFGLGESSLTERIHDVITRSDNPSIATYVRGCELILRITARASTHKQASKMIDSVWQEVFSRVGSYCYSEGIRSLEEVVVDQLRKKKQTISVAESCTGGLITHLLTTIPGSSSVVKGGLVSYTNEIKEKLLQVSPQLLATEGAVSVAVAEQLVESVHHQFSSDYALSMTGVAGPDEVENKQVGQIYIGLAGGEGTQVKSFVLKGKRKRIQWLATKHALFLLHQRLKKGESTT